MFSQLKDNEHIELKFHYVAWNIPHEWDLGVLGVRKFSVGFAMVPHRLCVLVLIYRGFGS